MTSTPSLRLHANCVSLDGAGVLLRGPSGAGKSDLTLRLIDAGAATLVADDQTIVSRKGDELFGHAPDTLAGKLEVRGLGIVDMPFTPRVRIVLTADLMPADEIARLPESGDLTEAILGLNTARVAIDPSLPGAAARLRIAVRHLCNPQEAAGNLGLVAPVQK